MSEPTPGEAAARIGIQFAQRASRWVDMYIDALKDDDLSIVCHRWLPPIPDPLTVSNWWAWREDCGCPGTSFGRNPHRWDCPQTPIWEQTMRAGYIPTMEYGTVNERKHR